MLLIRDIRPLSASWDLESFTRVVEDIQAKLLRSPSSRSAFLTALPADILSGAPGTADKAALTFFKDHFPVQWTLKRMSDHGLSYCSWTSRGSDISLSGELVDAWMVHSQTQEPTDKETAYRSLCLEFILTTAIAHALYHALEMWHSEERTTGRILRLTDGSRLSQDGGSCSATLNLWGGLMGATWKQSALLDDNAEDFVSLEGIFLEIMRDGRLAEMRLGPDTLRSALRRSTFVPIDPAKLSGRQRRPVTAVVRRRQCCSTLPAGLLETLPPPWETSEALLSPPVTPPSLFYSYGDCESDDDDEHFEVAW